MKSIRRTRQKVADKENVEGNATAEQDELPTREQLAALAIHSPRKTAEGAVNHALQLWREAGKILAIETLAAQKRDAVRRGLMVIPFPKTFPATLDEFLKLIVKAKTPADSTKRFRDFYRETLYSFPTKPDPRGFPSDDYALYNLQGPAMFPKRDPSEKDDPVGSVAQREKWAADALKGWSECGFTCEQEWGEIAGYYLRWWKKQKSAKSIESSKKSKASIVPP